MAKDKWVVYGEYGDSFSNLKDAKKCAREASKTEEHDFEADVTLIYDGCNYINFKNGKCIRDGWKAR